MQDEWSTLFTECRWLLGYYRPKKSLLMHRRFGIEFAPEVVQADGDVGHPWGRCFALPYLHVPLRFETLAGEYVMLKRYW